MSHAPPQIPTTRIPRGPEEVPVFAAPWEAKAFALVVALHRQGHFTWPEWSAALAREIAAAGDEHGSAYYLRWLGAAEKLVTARALCAPDELDARRSTLAAAQGGPAPATGP